MPSDYVVSADEPLATGAYLSTAEREPASQMVDKTAGPVCSVHECGQPANFTLTWPPHYPSPPRDYCWPCLRSRYYRHPWDMAAQEPIARTRASEGSR